ncbi:YqaJ viral recombinase family protein [Bartonella krasnovii]|uniref:lambda exonuclease family protein n=1 Tax=Bartonella krasnovii TaxID=2267275 RepID=UPI001F4CC9B3|nr:lambda exonuclease family protein [Bartonella krasnovii]UNF41901.1 YqaJ viral recombinase family protein [Bartonella krasnovii]UNF55108.1 YqaJ viral recombinase family protein [Bartonella krasnovii]
MPIIIDCVQGTEEWQKARNGLITASLFEMVMAEKKQGQKTSRYHSVMMKLAGERITGKTVEEGTTLSQRRGIELEPSARQLYGKLTQTEPECIGFVLADDRKQGFSPDAFVGENGLLEIKTKKPEILIPHFAQKNFPEEHKAQCQGGLWISQREWVDLMLYWPDMPPLIKRAYRDEAYIRKLEIEIHRFNEALEKMVQHIKRFETGFGIRTERALKEVEERLGGVKTKHRLRGKTRIRRGKKGSCVGLMRGERRVGEPFEGKLLGQ